MPVPRRALALLLVPVLLTGCLGFGKDDAALEDAATNESDAPALNNTLPDGREFEAAKETNKTEEGVGGVDHKHDYWKGKEQVVIYDFDVPMDVFPVFERGDNSKVLVAFVNLESLPEDPETPALVYEGTGKVTFTITKAPAWASQFRMTYRTAAQDWTAWQNIEVGKPFEYAPQKTETDMPHSFRSLWNWKLQANGPVPLTAAPIVLNSSVQPDPMPLHVQIVVEKAHDVDDWPGHPAFYDGVNERVVVNTAKGKAEIQHAADVLIYGVEPDQIVPDRLISMGTRHLDVYVNITRLDMPPGVTSDGFTLFWRTAATQPSELGYNPGNNETDGKTWAYWHLTVSDDELDSPYQPTSRFSFKVLANAQDSTLARCYRCVPYTIEYTMTVIARPDPAAVPAMPEE